MQIQAKIGVILYDRDGKPGRGLVITWIWNWVRLHSSNYKSLAVSMQSADRWLVIVYYSILAWSSLLILAH